MTSDTGIPFESPVGGKLPDQEPPSETKLPESWKEAFGTLVSSRIAIIQAESGEAVSTGVKKAVLVAVIALSALLIWILVLAGAVGAIAAATELMWYHMAFIAAGVHLIIAIIAVFLVKAKSAAPFPMTRAEFEKDKAWLNQLSKKPN